MTKYKLEYIWLDGYEPVPNLRSKTKVKAFSNPPTLEEIPLWGFDGSSTRQAEGSNSDCLLKPVALFPDPAKAYGMLVMCEVLLPDGTPHPSNTRATIPDDPGTWFGFEQEYFLYQDGAPLGFPREGFPPPQGEYYTGVGYKNVGDVAREIVYAHLDLVRKTQAELTQNLARLAHRARAIGLADVPRRRLAEQRARVARTQRANDYVMAGRRVLDRH